MRRTVGWFHLRKKSLWQYIVDQHMPRSSKKQACEIGVNSSVCDGSGRLTSFGVASGSAIRPRSPIEFHEASRVVRLKLSSSAILGPTALQLMYNLTDLILLIFPVWAITTALFGLLPRAKFRLGRPDDHCIWQSLELGRPGAPRSTDHPGFCTPTS